MQSDTENKASGGGDTSLLDAVHRETSAASEQAAAAVGAAKDQAKLAASTIADKAVHSAETGKDFAASNLEDFAASIRKASEELGSRDQSMISNLVREAASGLEHASRSVKGASIQDITQSVAGFARRQPGAFLLGAGLVGIALGRFARASGEHGSQGSRGFQSQGAVATRPETDVVPQPGFDPSQSGSGLSSSWTAGDAITPLGSDLTGDVRPMTGDDYVR